MKQTKDIRNEIGQLLDELTGKCVARGLVQKVDPKEIFSLTDETTSQILSLLEEAVGEEWHHNSATWCAGANTRRKDILNKINPEKGKSNE